MNLLETRNALQALGWPQTKSLKKHPEIYNAVIANTEFLQDPKWFSQRLYCIYEMLIAAPVCPVCMKNDLIPSPKPLRPNSPYQGWSLYCSKSCAYSSDDREKKKKESMLERYGVEYTAQSESLRRKMRDTTKKRTGFEAALQNPKSKEKLKETMMLRHGVEWAQQSENIREKSRKSLIDNYGVDSPLKSPLISQKKNKTFADRYGGHPMKSEEISKKVSVALKNKTQEERNSIKEKMVATCMLQGKLHPSQYHISESSYEILQNKEMLQCLYDSYDKRAYMVASHLGIDGNTAVSWMRQHGIEVVKNHSGSYGEDEVKKFIKDLGVDFVSNSRDILGTGEELDIFIPEKKFAIEYNGVYWHSTQHKTKEYHQKKSLVCKENGIRLLHIWEDDWVEKRQVVEQMIKTKLGIREITSVFGRQCSIVESDFDSVKNLLNENHIQGAVGGSLYISIMDRDGKVVGCAVFYRMSDEYDWELRRYCTSTSVVGGFSKLISFFKKNYQWRSITTYADFGVSDGSLYEKTGFTSHGLRKPSLWYVKGNRRYRREHFMKHKLKKLLENFDEALTETENMINHGYYPLYDAGLIKYVMCK